jgi:hypothetical protein
MIIYNVTLNIENSVADDFLEWMKTIHIPDVMATGLFISYKILKLLNDEEDNGGTTFAMQYYMENLDKYEHYQLFHATRLQNETRMRYEGKYVAFRTLLEVISES